ncbi:hypothetical protein [Streptomyces sp. NPDC000880]
MGRHQWGTTVVGVLLTAAAIVGVSGCGGDAEAQKQPAAKPKTVSITAATMAFQDAVTGFDLTDGCPKAAGECWDKMTAVMEPARELRKAMNAHKAGPEFWSEAYVLIDTMEDGMAVGEDRFTNRPAVLGSAHDLYDWLDEHPVE